MALTKEEYLAKLKKFVPSWLFEKDRYTRVLFTGIAGVFAQMDVDADDHFNATFLTRAAAPVLDLMGDERDIPRVAGESNSAYAMRVQRITNLTDVADILAVVNSLLLRPGAKIREATVDSPYASRGSCCDRDQYLCDFLNDFFTLVVPNQVHAPYSFASRSLYASRGGYAGELEALTTVFNSIVAAVNAAKAEGVTYRLIVSNNSTVF